MPRDDSFWMGRFMAAGALWMHDGNPMRPHALLTAGNHSNGFFNAGRITELPLLLDEATNDLGKKLALRGLDPTQVDRVVGPAMGAITLAHDVARHIGTIRLVLEGSTCMCAYAEKVGDGADKGMVFNRTAIKPRERILIVEDTMTTGGSVGLVAEAVTKAGGVVLPFVGVIVNRSGKEFVDGRRVVSLVDLQIESWLPQECPLCRRRGSRVLRPKEVGNWELLTAKYPTVQEQDQS